MAAICASTAPSPVAPSSRGRAAAFFAVCLMERLAVLFFSVIYALSAENVLHIFLNPRLPRFGLLGRGKIKNISSLPPRRQRVKSRFQFGNFIQLGLKFLRNFE